MVSKFASLSFIIILLTGLLTGWAIAYLTSQEVLSHTSQATARIVNTLLKHHLSNEDFRKPLSKSRYEELDKFIQENLISDEMLQVKIWSPEGRIIYAKDQGLVERKFPLGKKLKQALQGKIVARVSDLKEEENSLERGKYKRLVEVYIPIYLDSSVKPVGVYEIYQLLEHLNFHLSQTRKYTWGPLAAGLFLLYFGLFGLVRRASNTILKQNTDLQNLTRRLENSLEELQGNYLGTINALSAAVDAKDHYTAGHSLRVAEYVLNIGRELGLSLKKLKHLERAALFHDIGKIGVPEPLLNKAGKLTPEEYRRFKSHSIVGANIIKSTRFLEETVPIIRHHHEHYDGTGYPDGLAGKEIPLEARILAVADTYDAMTSDRPYRKALTKKGALGKLREESNGQFDAKVVESLIKSFQKSKKRRTVPIS